MVFYRKYRPQNISELDLESVRTRLSQILAQKEIPHAFLFTGPKGLGKTSTARILAKAINCESKKKGSLEPCNECDICQSITNGSNLDVLEIDAASNRGIDEIRELRERIKFAPAALSKKVYIIDEVHMLTTDAFNALLKTLEEPPIHAIFILCTTELEKVPPTITSRTFHITFKKPTRDEAIASLKRIVEGEKLDVEESIYPKILALSEGSFRDATKILQELSITAADKKITDKILSETYKTGNMEKAAEDILGYLAAKDTKNSLKIIEELSQTGADFKVVTEKLADALRIIILARAGLEDEAYDIKEFETQDLVRLLNLVNESYQDIKTSVIPSLPLEIAVSEWCLGDDKIEMIIDKKDTKSLRDENKTLENEEEEQKIEIKTSEKGEVKPQENDIQDEKKNVGMFSKNVVPETFFAALIDAVKRDNHSIAGILRGCKLVELNDEKAIFEAKYKFHRDKLNEAKTIAILDKRASELLNRKVNVVVEMVTN